MLFRDEVGYDLGDISDDGRWLALAKPNTTADSDIYLWNTATGEATHISKHEGVATYEPATFDPASKWLYYLTNDGSEFMRVRRYALTTGKPEDVEKADWDIVSFLLVERQVPPLRGQRGRAQRCGSWTPASGEPVAAAGFPPANVRARASRAARRGWRSSSTGTARPNNLYVLRSASGGRCA